MKIHADRKALAAAVKTAMRANGRSHLTVLNGVRLEATDDGRLTVTCTDIEMAITADVAVQVDEPGVAIPPARLVAGFLGGGGEQVEVATDEDEATATLTSGDATLRVRLLAVNDWPALPEAPDEWADLSAEQVDLIGRVAVSASTDTGRPILTGVKFRGTDVLATDSFRLAIADLGVDLNDVIVPARLLSAAVEAAGGDGCRYAASARTAWFATDGVEMSGRLIAGEYPKAENLLRKKSPHHMEFDSGALLDAIDRIKVLTVDSSLVEVEPDGGKVTLRRRSVDGDEITATVPVDTDFDERIGFNLGFLEQAVEKAGTDTVRLEIADCMKPVQIESGALTQLLMPIRLGVGS